MGKGSKAGACSVGWRTSREALWLEQRGRWAERLQGEIPEAAREQILISWCLCGYPREIQLAWTNVVAKEVGKVIYFWAHL